MLTVIPIRPKVARPNCEVNAIWKVCGKVIVPPADKVMRNRLKIDQKY